MNFITKERLIILLLSGVFSASFLGLSYFAAAKYLWIFVSIAATVLVTGIVFLWRTSAKTKGFSKSRIERAYRIRVARVFRFFISELKDKVQGKNKYDLPWYLLLSTDLGKDTAMIRHMGFKEVLWPEALDAKMEKLPIRFWLKEDAVLLSFENQRQGEHLDAYLKALCKCVIRYRARQPFNGVILSSLLGPLLSNERAATELEIAQHRDALSLVHAQCNQELPVYCVFNQLVALSDVCQYFASLGEDKLDGAFGAVNEKPVKAFDPIWFNDAYDHLLETMYAGIKQSLEGQLNEDFRRAVVNAPPQFALLRDEVAFYLHTLFPAPEKSHGYLRGFYFANTDNQARGTDILSMQVAQHLGQSEISQSGGVKLPHALFARQLFEQAIRPEASLAGINRARRRMFWLSQSSYITLLVIVLVGSIGLLKLNFDFYSERNQQVTGMLEDYEEQIRTRAFDIDDLATNVENLHQLRRIYHSYKDDTPFYVADIIPNPSIAASVDQAYHQQLKAVLLPSLVRYLEEELFVYMTLGDSLATARLLTLDQQLVEHNPQGWNNLKTYYRESLIKEGHTEPALLDNLMLLMDDLYTLGVPEIQVDKLLVSQSRESISSANTTQVLFDHILEMDAFNRHLDIRDELGQGFDTIYRFKPGYTGVMVPYIYTPQGFSALDLSTDSEMLTRLINENNAIFDHSLTYFETANLSKSLRRYYVKQYVLFWQTFIDNIEINPVAAPQRLATFAEMADSPLVRLFDTLGRYTRPVVMKKPQAKDEAKNTAKADEAVDEKATRETVAEEEMKALAHNIRSEFTQYHALIKADKKGQSQLGQLHKAIIKVNDWWKEAKDAEQGSGKFLFEQLSSKKANQSLSLLSQQKLNVELLAKQITSLVSDIDAQVNQQVIAYLNGKWKQEVYDPFELTLARRFPFTVGSDADASFANFNRFFKPGGVLDGFSQRYLPGFEIDGQARTLHGFTRNGQIGLSQEIGQQLDYYKQIQQSLYGQNDFGLGLKLKPSSMSSDTLEFNILSGRNILNYQHGPKLWQSLQWPNQDDEDELLLVFKAVDDKKYVTRYSGDWAWFRMIQANYAQSGSKTMIRLKQGEQFIELRVETDVTDGVNPLQPTFFSRLSLASELINTGARH